MKSPGIPTLLFLATALTHSLSADTFTWNGSSGNWDSTSKWTSDTLPTEGADLVFGNRTSDRLAIYRSLSALNNSMKSHVNSLTITQVSPGYTNAVELWRVLTVDEAITLASSGGTSLIRLYTSTSTNQPETGSTNTTGPVLTVPSITLNSGGVLEFAKIRISGSQSSTTQVQGDVVISGGTLSAQNAARYTSSVGTTSFTHIIDGDLTMTSGLLEVGAASTYYSDLPISNSCLNVTGNLSLSGGVTTIHTSLSTDLAKITASSITYGGGLNILIGDTVTAGTAYSLFSSTSQSGDFSSVSITGLYETTLNDSDGTWTGDASGFRFSFVKDTGLLTVTAIPEPLTTSALLGACALLSAAALRRSARNGR